MYIKATHDFVDDGARCNHSWLYSRLRQLLVVVARISVAENSPVIRIMAKVTDTTLEPPTCIRMCLLTRRWILQDFCACTYLGASFYP